MKFDQGAKEYQRGPESPFFLSFFHPAGQSDTTCLAEQAWQCCLGCSCDQAAPPYLGVSGECGVAWILVNK